MNEDDKTLLIQVNERSESNAKRIEELQNYSIKGLQTRCDKIEHKVDDLHEITTAIKLIGQDMDYMKKGQVDLTNKVDGLSTKLDSQGKEIRSEVNDKVSKIQGQVYDIQQEPYTEYKETKHELKVGVISKILTSISISVISILSTLFATGNIKI